MNPADVGVEEIPRIIRLHLLPSSSLQHLRRRDVNIGWSKGVKSQRVFLRDSFILWSKREKDDLSLLSLSLTLSLSCTIEDITCAPYKVWCYVRWCRSAQRARGRRRASLSLASASGSPRSQKTKVFLLLKTVGTRKHVATCAALHTKAGGAAQVSAAGCAKNTHTHARAQAILSPGFCLDGVPSRAVLVLGWSTVLVCGDMKNDGGSPCAWVALGTRDVCLDWLDP